jgi:hypothetical protein
MSPGKWDMEKMIAMCVQEEDRLKASNGGSINYVKDNRKRKYQTAIKVLPPSHMEKVPNSIISPLSQWIKTSVSTARRLGSSRMIA